MASEDSTNRDGFRRFIVSAIAAIRLTPSIDRWTAFVIRRTTAAKLAKSQALAVLSGCSSKKRNDAVLQIPATTDAEAPHVLAVVVVATVDRHRTTLKELLHLMQHRCTATSLHHRKLRLNLPARTTRWILEDRDAEATLAVDEADDPLHS